MRKCLHYCFSLYDVYVLYTTSVRNMLAACKLLLQGFVSATN